jgi:hypothetical protein
MSHVIKNSIFIESDESTILQEEFIKYREEKNKTDPPVKRDSKPASDSFLIGF